MATSGFSVFGGMIALDVKAFAHLDALLRTCSDAKATPLAQIPVYPYKPSFQRLLSHSSIETQ